ncbi:dipeptide/oligopeptide/nickel ABC transporter ATP-binding protein [Catellatospora sp. TT07R-123]|uniref:ABC transporter ATP-binding protein n=1 Tax=Catellatospora sp. TT07R-123 TaxID=2733863 RepID=UPI001B224E1C|nr:ABC transporter ATP-binding protein [Catellatospora sp. TT07R-123]GHJ47942.1 dipeptide/oligopeptide/nickel ABC transporter ATP-binding protein [Catellatospora sp. TT07R-123]
MSTPYLQVENLTVRLRSSDGVVRAVNDLSFSVARGRTLGIVGESGSGKTVTGLAVLGLHDARKAEIGGRILVDGTDLQALPERERRRLRGGDLAMIFQDPLSALHPYYTVGRQIIEAHRTHDAGVGRAAARRHAIDLLGRVGIPQPQRRIDQYPHEFSGGMRQRAMIAMALVNNPKVLIADEPTTALDVTVQAQILDLLADLQREFQSAIIMITHDLGVVRQVAHDVLVMYGGRAVEHGSAAQVLGDPQHPYTWGLLASVPSLTGPVTDDLVPIPGNPPSLVHLPAGCAFHPRCRFAGRTGGASRERVPELLVSGEPGHLAACHLPAADRRAARTETGVSA